MALKSLVLMPLIVGGACGGCTKCSGTTRRIQWLPPRSDSDRWDRPVPCLLNSTTSLINGTFPVFPNAVVQLKWGGNVASSATSIENDVISILLDPLQYNLSTVLNTCRLEVPTQLSSCDSSLPVTGVLQSALHFVGNTVQGPLRILMIHLNKFNLID